MAGRSKRVYHTDLPLFKWEVIVAASSVITKISSVDFHVDKLLGEDAIDDNLVDDLITVLLQYFLHPFVDWDYFHSLGIITEFNDHNKF